MNRFSSISTETVGHLSSTSLEVRTWDKRTVRVRLTKRNIEDIVRHLQSVGRVKLTVK